MRRRLLLTVWALLLVLGLGIAGAQDMQADLLLVDMEAELVLIEGIGE